MAGSAHRTCTLLILGMLAVSDAYPFLYVSRMATSCTSHPATSYMGGRGGGHLAPIPDPAAKFHVSIAGAPVAKLCPGASHLVKVTLASPRYGLLTSSVGEFAEGDPWECPNRVLLDGAKLEVHKANLALPCEGHAASAVLQLTTAEGVGQHFLSASTTMAVDPTCSAAKCKAQRARLPTKKTG